MSFVLLLLCNPHNPESLTLAATLAHLAPTPQGHGAYTELAGRHDEEDGGDHAAVAASHGGGHGHGDHFDFGEVSRVHRWQPVNNTSNLTGFNDGQPMVENMTNVVTLRCDVMCCDSQHLQQPPHPNLLPCGQVHNRLQMPLSLL
jgi:hypothetical protein